MAKTDYINVRIAPKDKAGAHRIFKKLGISPSLAVTMFYKRVVAVQGLPFTPIISDFVPNKATIAALEENDRAAAPANREGEK